MFRFDKASSTHSVNHQDEKKDVPQLGITDSIRLLRELKADLHNIGSAFESVARNWAPLLPVAKDFINYLTVQFAEMSDPNNPDPSWKEFSNEALSALDKLQPILNEFSKSKSHYPQLLKYVEDLFRHLPRLIAYFDKLRWHERVSKVMPRGDDLQNDFRDLMLNQLKTYLPHYDTIKKYLEAAYKQFNELNGIEEFSKRSAIEKIVLLCAMENFNSGLESIFLALNRASVQLGIREGYLLSHPLFLQNQLSINQLCEQFDAFYNKALADMNIQLSHKPSAYPFQDQIILQQREMLKALEDNSQLQEKIVELYKRTVTDIIEVLEKAQAMPCKDNDENTRHIAFLSFIIKSLTANTNQNDLILIISQVVQLKDKITFKSKKNDKVIEKIYSILNDMKSAVIIIREKEKNAHIYLKARIRESEGRYEAAGEDKIGSIVNSIKKPDTSYADIKIELTEIMQQAKKINDTLATRSKKEDAPSASDSVSKIEKALNILYGQLEVMLDRNIYLQYIQFDGRHEKAMNFRGEGWVVKTGSTLAQIKRSFGKYKELSAYFSKQLNNSGDHSPKQHLLLFTLKSRELAQAFAELIASFVALEKDPFVNSILSSAGLKKLIYANDIVAVEEKSAPVVEHKLEIEPTDAIEKVLNTIANIYKKSAKKYPQSDEEISRTIQTMFHVHRLTLDYQAFKAQDKNKIQISNAQMFSFILTHAKELFSLLSDVPNAFSALLSVSKKEFSVLIRELNLALRDLVLMFNRIEIEFNLKQGFFTQNSLTDLFTSELQDSLKINALPLGLQQISLHRLITDIYLQLENLNYTFTTDEKYPFLSPLQDQQTLINQHSQAGTLKVNYSSYFIFQTQTQIMQSINAEVAARNKNNKEYTQRFNALIDENIYKLQAEKNTSKKILIALLGKLSQRGMAFVSLDRQLYKLSINASDKKNMYLLYQSHTRKLMQQLYLQTATRQDLLNVINDSIEKLSAKSAQSYYLFAQSRRSKIIATLYAFQELRQLLARPGYKVTDFALESPLQYNLLVKHNKKLLENLLQYSELSVYLKNEKMLAGDVLPEPKPELSLAKQLTLKIQQKLAIEKRISDIATRCIGATGNKKIKLLQALQVHLQTTSIERSLNTIRQDKKFQDDFHLLYAGKTGKMLKGLMQLSITRQDLLKQINLEIYRLKHSRQQSFWFSEHNKKALIEARIQACYALSNAVDDSPEGSLFENILTQLASENRTLLLKYEANLINKIKSFEASKERLNTVDVSKKARNNGSMRV